MHSLGDGSADGFLKRAEVLTLIVGRNHEISRFGVVKGLSESWDVGEIGGEDFRAFGCEELQMRSVPANYADSFSTGEKIFSYDMAGVAARSENYVHKRLLLGA